MNRAFLYAVVYVNILSTFAQRAVSLSEAIELCVKNSPKMLWAQEKVSREKEMLGSTVHINNMDLVFEAPTGKEQRLGLMQFVEAPIIYVRQYNTQKASIEVAKAEANLTKEGLKLNVSLLYNQLQFLEAKVELLKKFDSLFSKVEAANTIRYKVGEIAKLEKLSAEARYRQIYNQLLQAQAELRANQVVFSSYLTAVNDTATYTASGKLQPLDSNMVIDKGSTISNKYINSFYESRLSHSKNRIRLEKSSRWPGIF
ncbi:MAG TPA: TolC family protein, partial [Cytophagales bacterium]|nr:TolC family protein [Cytophagales bacterium]